MTCGERETARLRDAIQGQTDRADGLPRRANPAQVEGTLAILEALIGLAPSDIMRRRLAPHGALLERAAAASPRLDDSAWAEIVDLVTVQETRLFRNPAQLAALHATILPQIATRARDRGVLRLLSAGCATGEEVWTLAALALDAAASVSDADGRAAIRVEVVGLDLSRPALAVARSGRYPAGPPDALRDVPAAFHHAFPRQETGWLAVSASLRRAARFRRANLLEPGEPAGCFDVVLFRNVGIYLTDAARREAGLALAALLCPGGALLLGPTDRPPRDADLVPWDAASVSIHRREGRGDDGA